METRGILGGGGQISRRFRAGNNTVAGQVVVADTLAHGTTYIAQVQSPSNNSDTVAAVGIVLDSSPPTYTTTQGNGANTADRFVDCTYHPLQLFAGRYSSNATAYAAVAAALDGVILTNSTANSAGVLISDANVGTSNYSGGLMLALTGNSAGQTRAIASYSANTSQTVTVPFDYTLAANDTFARVPNIFSGNGTKGILMTNDYLDFMQVVASGVVSQATVIGGTVVFDVEITDASGAASFTLTPHGGASTGQARKTNVVSPSAPTFKLVSLFLDHVFGKRL